MTVYIEYVLIDNFVIDFLLLKTSFLIAGKKLSKLRLVICSLLGAVFALLYPLIVSSELVITVVKILFGLFLAFSSGKFANLKEYITFTSIFLGLTFFVGGAIIGTFSLLGLNCFAEYSIGLMILPVYMVIKAITRIIRIIYRKKDVYGFTAKFKIFFGERSIMLNGFFDTGNSLYDDLSPVIVVSKRAIMPVITPNLLKNSKKITIETATGKESKFLLKPDRILIYYGQDMNIFYNVSVCVIDKIFNGYDAVLHPALMEKHYEQIAL